MKIKRFLGIFLILCLFSSLAGISAESEIHILVNNESVLMDQEPVIENGRTLVPLRAIFESLGAEVLWDDTSKAITGTRGNAKIKLTIGNNQATVNENTYTLDVPAKMINDRTLVPVRFIAESLNCHVAWQEKSKTVIITDGENSPKRDLTVHFLDVGQADSILILLPNGENMLIDGGNDGDQDLIINYIKGLGISHLHYVIATHPHEDHIGGLDDVINNFSVGNIYMSKVQTNTKTFEDLLLAIQNKGLIVQTAKSGLTILNQNGITLNLVAPVSETYADLNSYSAVLKLTYINREILFTGDAEAESESQIASDISADVLKVGHHGSNSSTSDEFLKKVSPQYAIISVGADNSYGHPKQEIVAKLNQAGIKIYRTDQVGTIVLTSDGNQITVDKAPLVIETTKSDTNQSETVYVTKTGIKYHRDGCSSLSKSKIAISLTQAKKKFEPCSICNPPR